MSTAFMARLPNRPARMTFYVLTRAARGTMMIPAKVKGDERNLLSTVMNRMAGEGLLTKTQRGRAAGFGKNGLPAKWDITHMGRLRLQALKRDWRLKRQ